MNRPSGGFKINFKENILKYKLEYCSNFTNVTENVPTAREKFWTIQKRGHQIVAFCNGKLVVNVTASSETCNDPEYSGIWDTVYWNREVDKIEFLPKLNKASRYIFIGIESSKSQVNYTSAL